ncbi:MAG: hypothetical protein GC192_09080 [Bacteroidetes bacterium]|nr:hypothetical protein [Bacteroidota bacterium]
MTTDVNKAIQELLFEKTAVIVPGLGGFTSMPGSATVDYVQDVITPPTSKLEFNPNLVLNDGILVQYLQKHNISTYQEAEGMVERYVNTVRDTLERREIYEIPKVGRLYQDYEQKIRFMPEGTNFNADSFGLPTIDFQPLVREKPKVAPPMPKPTVAESLFEPAEVAAIKVDESPASLTMKVLPWAVLLLAILIALSLYNIFGGQRQKPIAEVPERVNVKPSLPEESGANKQIETSPTEDNPSVTQEAEKSTPPASKPEATIPDGADTEQDSFEPTKDKLYMVVHSFGVKNNATKFAQTLTEDGYATQTKRAGKLYRVGVTFAYNSQSDIEKMRKELATKYKAGPKTEKELEEMGQ